MADLTPTIARRKPDPVPAIFPLPERDATGERLEMYEDTKAVLQVPWMGVVTMAFSHYPTFYRTLWQGLRPLCASVEFVAACADLRDVTEAAIADQPSLLQQFRDMGYGPVEIDQINAMIEIFSHGNMPYILIATAARLLLEGHEIGTGSSVTPNTTTHGPEPLTKLVLMERHHGNAGIHALYDDIEATLGLPFVNTDYRALARWPSYFDAAWGALRDQVDTPDHTAAVATVHAKTVSLIESLPNPNGLTSAALIAAAEADGAKEQITDTVRLFQWLLPGLLVNVAIFQAQMQG